MSTIANKINCVSVVGTLMDANNASYVLVNQIVSRWEGGEKVLQEFT